MKISKISIQDESIFNKLAKAHGTIFNTAEWTRIFNKCIHKYGIYHKGGEMIGGVILYEEKKFGFSMYCNPPYTPEIGPFLKIDASNPANVMDTLKKAMTSIAAIIEELPYSIVSVSLNKNIIDMQPFIWGKFKVTPAYTYMLDLTLPLEDILMNMSNERRKNIRKSLKDGLYSEKCTDLEIIKALVLKTFSRQKNKLNKYYLNKILFEFANNKNSFAFVTFKKNDPISCSFCIYDKDTAYYLLGGYDHENKHHGAGALSIWEAIKYTKNINLNYFDFEGSMIPQIETFFRGFGGRLTPCYRINKAKLPWEIFMKFYKRQYF